MATPLINTVPMTAHVPVDLGSGSNSNASAQPDFGSPTGIAPRNHVYYLLTDLLHGHSSNSAPTALLREKSADPVGQWLYSTERMLLEVDGRPPASYARALEELKANMGVTLTYIARCLGMQRSAIYRWYEGRQPHAANRSRLETIREFAAAWRAAKQPSLRSYWDASVPGSNSTLGELLSSETLDVTALRGAIVGLIGGAPTIAPKAPRLGFPGRERNRLRDQDRLSVLIPPTSREDDGSGDK